MKISRRWLMDFIAPESLPSGDALAALLTARGLEVESHSAVAVASGLRAGRVIKTQQHPQADKLKVCEVDMGDSIATIVCGAPNVADGQMVVVAPPSAKLGEMTIEKRALRGVESAGMICSAAEIGLLDDSSGILVLHDSNSDSNFTIAAGSALDDYLQLNDVILDVNITPNRGDCLSHLGVAREVAAAMNVKMIFDDSAQSAKISQKTAKTKGKLTSHISPIQQKQIDALTKVHQQLFSLAKAKDRIDLPPFAVKLHSAECPYYGCVQVCDTHAGTAAPIWMQTRLHRCGARCVSLAVDITNYVMLALGQPLHAFDSEKLRGGIHVRMAQDKEKVALLDGQVVECDTDTLLIADEGGGVALGGVMGGAESAVASATKHVLLEAAHFHPSVVRGRTLRYGVVSEAAYRFERGVDTAMPSRALHFASYLLTALAGGQAGAVHGTSSWKDMPQQDAISATTADILNLLGLSDVEDNIKSTEKIGDAQIVKLLTALGIATIQKKGALVAHPPSWRFDLECAADLAEEVIRSWGYEQLPETMPRGGHIPSMAVRPFAAARQRLAAAGFTETVSYAFVPSRWEAILASGRGKPVQLQNPISTDMSVMRTTLIGGLLDRAVFNLNRKHERIRLFEIGRCFVGGDLNDLHANNPQGVQDILNSREVDEAWRVAQPLYVAGVWTGDTQPLQWGVAGRDADFYDIRGMLEEFLQPAKPSVHFASFANSIDSHSDSTNAKSSTESKSNTKSKSAQNIIDAMLDTTWQSTMACPNYLHPGQAAAIVYDGQLIGVVGALHPAVAAAFDFRIPPFVFEIALEPLLAQRGAVQVGAVSHFPLVRRDLSVAASASTPASAVLECVRQASADTAVCDVTLFDCYGRDTMQDGNIFYGIRLTMQGTVANLTDEDINRAQDTVVQALAAAGITLRT